MVKSKGKSLGDLSAGPIAAQAALFLDSVSVERIMGT